MTKFFYLFVKRTKKSKKVSSILEKSKFVLNMSMSGGRRVSMAPGKKGSASGKGGMSS